MSEHHWLIKSTMNRVVLNARGPAVPLAKGLLEQIPQFMSGGMPVEIALRESLLLAIYAAQLKVRHCVGSERNPFEDFIKACMDLKAEAEELAKP